MRVKNRQQMAQVLNDRMTRTYSSLSERQELEPDTSLVKTYLIEAHLSESAESEKALALAEKVFSQQNFAGKSQVKTSRAEEPTLISVEMRTKDEHWVTYVDFTNSRYWLLHSLASSNSMDWMIQKLIKNSPELDRAWLSADFLEYISKLGSFRGLNLDYDRRMLFYTDDSKFLKTPLEFLKMQLWGDKAADVLRILRDKKAFPHETTLSKVKIKFWLDKQENGDFSLDDIKYDGKITARGTSFQSHISLISHIYEKYALQIRKIEKDFALKSVENDGRLNLEGEPINIMLGRPIDDLNGFCESVFSSSEPFRLWGVPIQLSKYFYRVHAFDIHISGTMVFEISPDFIRIYLPSGSCGNSIIRFYTNMQHHYDSLIKALDGNGRAIFEF
ncbi:MAG: hypothetical protein WCD80_06595 [Desulfobaccales bacterium]